MPKPPPTSSTTTRTFSGGMPSRVAQRVARARGHLARQPQRQPVGRGVVGRERAARLHRRRREALIDEVERDDMRGLGEGGVSRRGVAVPHLRGDVAGRGRPDQRRARRRSPAQRR